MFALHPSPTEINRGTLTLSSRRPRRPRRHLPFSCGRLRHPHRRKNRRTRGGVPLCSTGLPRICVRQAVRDKHVVGAHAGTCSGSWQCAGVCRSAGVARLQEI
jgi:hypothetical protein